LENVDNSRSNEFDRRHFIDIMCTYWRTYLYRPEKEKEDRRIRC
jgi:hypothetical protein